MDIQTKNTVEVINAKYDLVNKLYTICQKSDYGDVNMKCCTEEMYAKIKLIKRLENYCFPSLITTTATSTVFQFLYTEKGNSPIGTIGYLYLNGVMASSYTVSTTITNQEAFYDLIVASGYAFVYHQDTINGSTEFNKAASGFYIFSYPCNINKIEFYSQASKGAALVLKYSSTVPTTVGVCSFSYSTCYNCIEDSDLPKMYEVLNKLAK